jgi:hypothetical protein
MFPWQADELKADKASVEIFATENWLQLWKIPVCFSGNGTG